MTQENQLIKELMDPKTRYGAFEKVVKAYSSQLYSQIRRIALNHEDTDDILQNTFLKAWTNIGTFRGESKISTWLYRIACNESITFLQQKKQHCTIDDPEANIVNLLMADEYFDGDETEAQFQQAINELPEKQRMIFNMKYFSEMKYEEISDILGTSIGGLKASYHLAVKKIESFFDNQD